MTAGCQFTAGLKEDGTVVTAGSSGENELKVDGWDDIVEISGGWLHFVGLKSDGTVVASGRDKEGHAKSKNGRISYIFLQGPCILSD